MNQEWRIKRHKTRKTQQRNYKDEMNQEWTTKRHKTRKTQKRN